MSSKSLVPVLAAVVTLALALGGTIGALLLLAPPPADATGPSPAATAAAAPAHAQVAAVQAPPAGAAASPSPSPVAVYGALSVPSRRATLQRRPLDAAAIRAGFATSGYRFSVRATGFASYGSVGGGWSGVVADPAHFELAFPASATITRYVRDGDHATATLGDTIVDVIPGGDLQTPDDLLPLDLYVATVEPWTAGLPASSADGTYRADRESLTAFARHAGLAATRWGMTIAVDAAGRLVAATFAGRVSGNPFEVELAVAYDRPPPPASPLNAGR